MVSVKKTNGSQSGAFEVTVVRGSMFTFACVFVCISICVYGYLQNLQGLITISVVNGFHFDNNSSSSIGTPLSNE